MTTKFHGSAMTPVGEPDVFACYEGRAVLVEVKHPDEKTPVEPAQWYRMGLWKKAGARVGVAYSVEEAIKIMEGVDDA